MDRRRSPGRWAQVAIAATALFVALTVAAAALYPGGTWFDASAEGHDLWRNFLCDLLHARALNGEPNALGSRLATAGLLAECIAIGALWQILAGLVREQPLLSQRLRVLGAVASAALVSVPLTPSDRFPWLHGIAVLAACTLGFGAALLATSGLWRSRDHRALAVALGATLLLALADFALYVQDRFLGGELLTLEPVLQRLVTALLVWFTLEASRRALAPPNRH